ncbi:TCR/Tet family MFS transporter [Phenylobacterium sp.]|uniref:TCR/Tet family MFS transporter n=1 Tax=Phenylobacterium sp. TaxID=1871053 RepID=UPI0030F3C7AC
MTETTPGRRRAAFGFIFASALANTVSFGLMIPILPNLIKQFVGGDTAQASEWAVVFAVTWGVIQFFCGPILGLMSDRWGRRPVLLISLFGLGCDFLLMAWAPNLAWLFIGRIISGATAATFSTANAYVADVTPPEQRAQAFGWMGSAFSFGFLVGPAIGGLLGEIDLRLPFLAASALTLLNWLYGLLILPESLPLERRATTFDWRRANPLGSLKLLRSHRALLGLAVITFLNQLANLVWPSIIVLYMGYRFGWSTFQVGLSLMAGGLMGILVQSFLVGPVVRRVGERGALLLGAGFSTLSFLWVGLAPNGWVYILGMPLGALSGFLIPGLQGLMTRRVAPHEQGQLQGANQSLNGVASVLGPLIFGLTFAWSVRHAEVFPLTGLAMLIAGGMMLIGFILALRTPRDPGAA